MRLMQILQSRKWLEVSNVVFHLFEDTDSGSKFGFEEIITGTTRSSYR
jgi:hypothetical protein